MGRLSGERTVAFDAGFDAPDPMLTGCFDAPDPMFTGCFDAAGFDAPDPIFTGCFDAGLENLAKSSY